MVLVAHDPYLVQTICNRCIVLEKGRVVFDGGSVEGVNLHFEMGHADTLAAAEVSSRRDSFACDTGDGQTAERNWLSPQPQQGSFRPAPTDEHPVVIDRFEVIPERHPFLATGHAAIIKIYCRSRIEIEAGWGFSVCTADLLTSIFSSGVGFNERRLTIRPGENEFRCRIQSLPLRAGTYAIRGGIGDTATLSALAVLGFEESPNFFTVKSEQADLTTNWQSMIVIPVEWLND
jgi:hypothetical protein